MTGPEIGELVVGAYLRIIQGCAIVQYNVHDFTSGSQGEIDVLGMDPAGGRLFLCEVATHLDGLHYPKMVGGKNVDYSVDKLREKLGHARKVAIAEFPQFEKPTFMIWSPRVSIGKKADALHDFATAWDGPGKIDVRINDGFTEAVRMLIDAAAADTKQRGEPFFRALQLLTHLRSAKNRQVSLRLE